MATDSPPGAYEPWGGRFGIWCSRLAVVLFGLAVAAVSDRRVLIQRIAAVRDRRYSELYHYLAFGALDIASL